MNITKIDAQYAKTLLPPRKGDGHKGDFGKVLVVGGSVGYTGAPVFAANAAVRGGCGLVFLAVPQCVYPIVAARCGSAMPFPLPSDDAHFASGALAPILERAEGCDCVAIGCGFGRSAASDALVRELLMRIKCPVVLDADGINAIAGHIDVLDARRDRATVLTPHEGEFLRVGGELSKGRAEAARDFALRCGCTLVLKGAGTLVAAPDGAVAENTSGNCGMAKGGSGDVLTGLVASLLAQGTDAFSAAALGVWLHGCAGDIAAERHTQYAMTPNDMLAYFGAAFSKII
ncbi:MAG: NAD(P)H-hydrate dehydratase [Oscillospiraceae bacterium]|nr:NAD(P)H-hydrate dehydratase [Oscillospiraceae bacterium]